MSYVEKLAREMALGSDDQQTLLRCRAYAVAALQAVVALAPETGVKLVSRDVITGPMLKFEWLSWADMHDAAPAVPEETRDE